MCLMRSPHVPMMSALGPVVEFRISVAFVDGPITRRVSSLTSSFDFGLRRIALALPGSLEENFWGNALAM